MLTNRSKVVDAARYAPCSDCNEGALTWHPIKLESYCPVCRETI